MDQINVADKSKLGNPSRILLKRPQQFDEEKTASLLSTAKLLWHSHTMEPYYSIPTAMCLKEQLGVISPSLFVRLSQLSD